MRQLFYYKMRQKFITKCGDSITICDSFYKMQRSLQNAWVHGLHNVSERLFRRFLGVFFVCTYCRSYLLLFRLDIKCLMI